MRSTRPIRSVPPVLVAVCLGLGVTGPTPARAQTPPAREQPASASGTAAPGVDVVVPAPPGPAPELGFERVFPPDQPREGEFYPERTRSVHDPAFVSGASTTVRTSRTSGVRMGLSGWTAPRVPFDFRESSGGVAFGLTIVWGVPLPEPSAGTPEPETPSQR